MSTSKPKIRKVVFPMPVRVEMDDGQAYDGHIDLVRQQCYFEGVGEQFKADLLAWIRNGQYPEDQHSIQPDLPDIDQGQHG